MDEKRLKIAFLNVYQNVVERGAETFVEELAGRLGKRHDVTVIAGDRVLPRRWPVIWRIFLDPQGLLIGWFTWKNLGKIWREKFDVVVPLNGGWQVLLVRLVVGFYGGKVVVVGQSGIGWDDAINLASCPNAFVVLSDKAKGWAKKVNPFVRVERISNGVDVGRFIKEGRRLRLDLERPVVLCVGALTFGKRIDLAIKAVAKMGEASLLVVGDGELKDELEVLGKQLLGERFLMMKLPFDRMPEVYRAADVFTLPSQAFHSFEIVLLEAMATGLPVVANDDLIRREIVGEAGILVDPEDTEAYGESLKQVLKKKWGEVPRKQAEKFDWDGITECYERLFLDLVR